MDLPIDKTELEKIIRVLWMHRKTDSDCKALYEKLQLTKSLMDEGLPYKKILREEHDIIC